MYLDLEAVADRARLAEPALYFADHADKLVVLDEIHRAPGLFETLRGVIDEGRREGRATGRFLLLGSAAVELLTQSSETLAGRIAFAAFTQRLPICSQTAPSSSTQVMSATSSAPRLRRSASPRSVPRRRPSAVPEATWR